MELIEKRSYVSPHAPTASGPYSPALRIGDWVFISAQGPIDAQTRKVIGSSIAEQTEAVLQSVRGLLIAAGAVLSDVVKVTIYLRDANDLAKVDEVFEKHFIRTPRPARTVVQATLVGPSNQLIAIDCTAFSQSQK
jgi:2-iminobutanoate/2-iminopropanoate deaminase